jgi:hypothetical protein
MQKNNIWSNLSTQGNISECEPLITVMPPLPPRSWAYNLPPMNVGMPSCESLASYFLRLSEAHCVTPRILFMQGMIDPNESSDSFGLVSPTDSLGTSQINSNGLAARKWVAALESITRRTDLQFLTFLPFQGAVSKRETCRPQRAWCPLCLEEQRGADGPISEHLLWTHKYVTVCPIHRLALQMKCPSCAMTSNTLHGSMRLGTCAKCGGWLGELSNASHGTVNEPENSTWEYELFVADQIRNLIAAATNFQSSASLETATGAIGECIDGYFEGNVSAFVRYVGLGKSTATRFGKTQSVSLVLMLRTAFVARVSVLDLLQNRDALSGFTT